MTGHDLQDRCRDALRLIEDPGRVPPDSPDFADATLCLGFVQGVGDTGALLAELDAEEVAALRNCKPARATAEQVTRLLMRHLEDRPEDANLPGAAIVLITLHDAFPCNG